MTETDDVLVVTLPAAGAPKRSKGPWPPVRVGKCFIAAKENAEKWPPKQHTSMVASEVHGLGKTAKFSSSQ